MVRELFLHIPNIPRTLVVAIRAPKAMATSATFFNDPPWNKFSYLYNYQRSMVFMILQLCNLSMPKWMQIAQRLMTFWTHLSGSESRLWIFAPRTLTVINAPKDKTTIPPMNRTTLNMYRANSVHVFKTSLHPMAAILKWPDSPVS